MSKLEKADILELTVNHLTKLHSPKDPVVEAKKFQAGFGQCAAEACRFIMSVPDLDEKVSQNLITHLSRLITAQPLTVQVPERPSFSPPHSPSSITSDRHHYYSDHERSSSDAEDSAYSGEGGSRHQWTPRPINVNIPPVKPAPAAMNGLLTTVDKVPSNQYPPAEYYQAKAQRNAAYFNRVPQEAKDAILKKIRQHIMEKRSNDVTPELSQEQPTHAPKEVYKNDMPYPYSVLNLPANSDTLDLRKVRSPAKVSPEKIIARCSPNRSDTVPPVENKVEAASLPEQYEFPMDYSNLPPKKKRKLLEFQEYKKQEEAKRILKCFYENEKRQAEGRAQEMESKWRPW